MPETLPLTFAGETLIARSDKTLYWPAQSALFAADLHFGKAAHFRKNGIPVPDGGVLPVINCLKQALDETGAKLLVILGDFFHSRANETFEELRKYWPQSLEQWLILGNHDIADVSHFQELGLQIFTEGKKLGSLTLNHHPPEYLNGPATICGHVHPAMVVNGKARQRIKMPCFHLEQHVLILPAMGSFTGTKLLKGDKMHIKQIGIAEARLYCC